MCRSSSCCCGSGKSSAGPAVAALAVVVSSGAAAVAGDVLIAVAVVLVLVLAGGAWYLAHLLRGGRMETWRGQGSIWHPDPAELPAPRSPAVRRVRALPVPPAAIEAPRPAVTVITDAPERDAVRRGRQEGR